MIAPTAERTSSLGHGLDPEARLTKRIDDLSQAVLKGQEVNHRSCVEAIKVTVYGKTRAGSQRN